MAITAVHARAFIGANAWCEAEWRCCPKPCHRVGDHCFESEDCLLAEMSLCLNTIPFMVTLELMSTIRKSRFTWTASKGSIDWPVLSHANETAQSKRAVACRSSTTRRCIPDSHGKS